MENQSRFWIGFNLVKGIGPVRLRHLLDHFGDIESAWQASRFQLQDAGLGPKLTDRLEKIRHSELLDQKLELVREQDIQVLTWQDSDYPERLRLINQSPYVLYIKGKITNEDNCSVAVVGSRRYSDYGARVSEDISSFLAGQGISLISGLARGIDGLAHRTALDSGGRTLAVLGCGVDQVYPPEHGELSARIIEAGALISDYPPGTPPEGSNFPPRNRIISGLSRLVIVIEAGIKSGALITANYAAEQGREVFAVPGKITSPFSKGTNLLLRQGAHPLLSVQDILDCLDLSLAGEGPFRKVPLPGNSTEAALYQIVGSEPLHVDQICRESQLPIELVTSTLALMELKGLVRKTFGMKYVARG